MTREQAVIWFAEQGQPGYQNRIAVLQARAAEYRAAGAERFADALRLVAEEIAEVQQAALDRYEDYVSDPLP